MVIDVKEVWNEFGVTGLWRLQKASLCDVRDVEILANNLRLAPDCTSSFPFYIQRITILNPRKTTPIAGIILLKR